MDFRNCTFTIAEVVDNKDDTKSGRVQLRFIEQNDENAASDGKLVWGQTMLDTTSASTAKVGKSPTGAEIGTRMLVMVSDDGSSAICLGSLPRMGKGKA